MPAVEIISLSVNNISTLADFACCSNLKELYLRKNAISDLNEVNVVRSSRVHLSGGLAGAVFEGFAKPKSPVAL